METDTPTTPGSEPLRPYPLPPLPPGRLYVENERVGAPADLFCNDTADPFDVYAFRARQVVAVARTPFQNVIIADTYSYGRALFLDGAIQSSQHDEELYHETLVQPAMLLHREPRDVLIIGGGEGATLREVIAHASVKRACMVDIDRQAVELCREHLPSWHRGAFSDPRVELRFEDGRTFVENDNAYYDVVIIDVVDMLDNGPAQKLYSRQFYEQLRRRLRPGGIVALQGLEFSVLDYKEHCALRRTLSTAFGNVLSYQTPIPSFLGTWGFILASDDIRREDIDPARLDRAIERKLGAGWLTHIDGEFLASLFNQDKECRFLMSLPGPVLEDDTPFVPPPDVEDLEPPTFQFPALAR